MEQIVSKYLTGLKVPISKKYVEKLIASHPDYPSMLSIGDTLERLGIRYKAARIEKEHIDKVKYPYLLLPDEGGREPRIVRDRQDLTANGGQDSGNKETGEEAIVMKAEPTDTIEDEENNRQRLYDRYLKLLSSILVAALAGVILLNLLPILNWVYTLLFVTALGGTGVGYLLIAKDVGISYKPVETFCRAGEKNNCDAVLNSEAARLFGDKINLSDAAGSYFLFQLMMLGLFVPLSGEISSYYGILASLSFVALPVVIYSLYYQMATARTWCRLCLIVDGILVVQAGLFGYMYISGMLSFGSIGLLSVALTAFWLAVTGSGLLLIKHMLKEKKESREAEVLANRIKYNPDVFTGLLFQQDRVDTTPFEQEVRIGGPSAPIQITMAASLECGLCQEGFEKAARLVNSYPGKVQLTIRLKVGGSHNGQPSPDTWLMGYWREHIVGEDNASSQTKQLLRDWYETMDLEKFRQEYELVTGDRIEDEIRVLIESHSEWMEQADIKGTPTFFVNGQQLPKQYRIDDLEAMIPSLVAHMEENREAGNGNRHNARVE